MLNLGFFLRFFENRAPGLYQYHYHATHYILDNTCSVYQHFCSILHISLATTYRLYKLITHSAVFSGQMTYMDQSAQNSIRVSHHCANKKQHTNAL